jgi:hypothetical protein
MQFTHSLARVNAHGQSHPPSKVSTYLWLALAELVQRVVVQVVVAGKYYSTAV